ncbi:hypothetical protein ONS95_010361 [Cadophora gregata]|uniref:uncharacterized protein n=1 Tax=Cadophora gregata TaxID=51156 RepID=UPI0026DDB7E8|nr:uncharacterized protein ONS95_010361 [Cadophora gregata]KAK0122099.1 hypothetical protein ONS95_010361 [Cadophora gregata]KAK0127573.1 hypothetical protein ONS96_007104 [Cadophora gregata f. sp. sojae]
MQETSLGIIASLDQTKNELLRSRLTYSCPQDKQRLLAKYASTSSARGDDHQSERVSKALLNESLCIFQQPKPGFWFRQRAVILRPGVHHQIFLLRPRPPLINFTYNAPNLSSPKINKNSTAYASEMDDIGRMRQTLSG